MLDVIEIKVLLFELYLKRGIKAMTSESET